MKLIKIFEPEINFFGNYNNQNSSIKGISIDQIMGLSPQDPSSNGIFYLSSGFIISVNYPECRAEIIIRAAIQSETTTDKLIDTFVYDTIRRCNEILFPAYNLARKATIFSATVFDPEQEEYQEKIEYIRSEIYRWEQLIKNQTLN